MAAEAAVQTKPEVTAFVADVERLAGPFLDLPLQVDIVLGSSEMTIAELLDLAPQSIVELKRPAGDDMAVTINGKMIARGAVIIIEEYYALRITEIVTRICHDNQ